MSRGDCTHANVRAPITDCTSSGVMHSFFKHIAASAARDNRSLICPVTPMATGGAYDRAQEGAACRNPGRLAQRQLPLKPGQEAAKVFVLLLPRKFEAWEAAGDLEVGLHRRQRVMRAWCLIA
jgi:hypothetical protein